VENFTVTTDKLSKKFELINKVEVKKLVDSVEDEENYLD